MEYCLDQRVHYTAGLNDIEIELFNLVLRWELQNPRRYLIFSVARKMLQERLPNGYLQLNAQKLMRAKKSANYEISKAKKTGKMNMLLEQLNMVEDNEGRIIRKRREKTLKANKNPSYIKDFPGSLEIPNPKNTQASNYITQPKLTKNEVILTADELSYMEENFKDSVNRIKGELQEKLSKKQIPVWTGPEINKD